jgi:hypothetical protein
VPQPVAYRSGGYKAFLTDRHKISEQTLMEYLDALRSNTASNKNWRSDTMATGFMH